MFLLGAYKVLKLNPVDVYKRKEYQARIIGIGKVGLLYYEM
jgi:hypothetical protein